MSDEASELLRAGNPAEALKALQSKIRTSPGDARLRIFLFQLLCITGDWKRAITQLKLCAELDAAALPMAQTYREGIICEVYREKVFAGEKAPLIFGEPTEWMALLIEALKVLASGNPGKAADLRARAFDLAPVTPGEINDTPFEWIADADMRLGPVLEAVVNGKYYWMPFNAISAIRAEAPVDLRDCVWTPVNLTLRNGGETVALIPTRYAGTTASDDPAALMARATHWSDAGAETFVGSGQRLLATDGGDVSLMDLRNLRLVPAEGEAGDGQ